MIPGNSGGSYRPNISEAYQVGKLGLADSILFGGVDSLVFPDYFGFYCCYCNRLYQNYIGEHMSSLAAAD